MNDPDASPGAAVPVVVRLPARVPDDAGRVQPHRAVRYLPRRGTYRLRLSRTGLRGHRVGSVPRRAAAGLLHAAGGVLPHRTAPGRVRGPGPGCIRRRRAETDRCPRGKDRTRMTFLAAVHSLTHRHVFTRVDAGSLRSCQVRLLPGMPDVGFRPDFLPHGSADEGSWYWVPPDMVQKIAAA